MSVLFFLPWVTTAEEVQLGSMRLIPYVRGEAPGQLHGFGADSTRTWTPIPQTLGH